MYTVKEVAELLGVSVHTVRYYDDRGLIPGTKRNSANQRLFDDMEVEWLFVSLTLKNTGLSLKDVRHYIELYQQGDSTLPERYELMQKQKEKTLQEMEELKLRLAVLDRKIDHYGKLLEGEEDTWSHEYMQKLIREGADHEKKVWLVTGCSKELGKALVEELIAQGYPVAGTSRSKESLEKNIGVESDLFLPLSMNVKDEADVKKAITQATEKFGRIDVVVNNAGFTHLATIEEMSDADAREEFDINVFGKAVRQEDLCRSGMEVAVQNRACSYQDDASGSVVL